MMVEVAMLPSDVWQDEATALKQINEIWARQQLSDFVRSHPFAWRVLVDAKAALVTEPKEIVDMSAVIADIRTALREHTTRCNADRSKSNIGSAIKSAFAPHIERLRKDLKKYENNPADLHRVLGETIGTLAHVAREERFEKEHFVVRLLGNLKVRATDICVASPEVLEMVQKRQVAEAKLMSAEQLALARKLAAGLASDARGAFQAGCAMAFSVLNDDARSAEEKAGAWGYIETAAAHSALAVLDYEEKAGKDGGDSRLSIMEKFARWGKRAKDIDGGIDAVQELGQEVAEWAPDAIDMITQLPVF
jgi:hypothetical protein